MKPTVIILLSDKRSGSTMFEAELCKHPAVNHVGYTPHSYFETHHWLKAACILKRPPRLFHGHKRYSGYGSMRMAKRYMIDCIKGNVSEFVVPENDAQLIFKGWEALCQKFARPVFFEKSPQHPHHWAALDLMLKWMEQTEFDVKFIGLVRNPMAVMYSAYQLFFTDPDERQFGWAHCYQNILAMQEIVGKERFLLVRYEDVIEQPKETFDKVCNYIGIEGIDTIGKGVHRQSKNKWIDDPAFTLQLDESVARMAKYFGYQEADLFNPVKSGLNLFEQYTRKTQAVFKKVRTNFINRTVKPIFLKTLYPK